MTKTDYEIVAVALQGAYDAAESATERQTVANVANALATGFERLNPRFDKPRFFKAIGLDFQPTHVKKVQP